MVNSSSANSLINKTISKSKVKYTQPAKIKIKTARRRIDRKIFKINDKT